MKLKILLAALFLAGLAASIALASPSSDGAGTTTGATASTSTGKGHDDAGKKSGTSCRNVELKGTIANGTLSLAVTGPGKHAKGPAGQTVTLAVAGKASVNARVCGAAGSQTYQLRELKVAESRPATTTTTTTP